jgi:hypothetical protein
MWIKAEKETKKIYSWMSYVLVNLDKTVRIHDETNREILVFEWKGWEKKLAFDF